MSKFEYTAEYAVREFLHEGEIPASYPSTDELMRFAQHGIDYEACYGDCIVSAFITKDEAHTHTKSNATAIALLQDDVVLNNTKVFPPFAVCKIQKNGRGVLPAGLDRAWEYRCIKAENPDACIPFQKRKARPMKKRRQKKMQLLHVHVHDDTEAQLDWLRQQNNATIREVIAECVQREYTRQRMTTVDSNV